jgi:hypothetical protein
MSVEVKVMGEPVKAEKKGEPDKWEIDCWVRTLVEAEEIKADPEKMKYVKPKLAMTKKAIDSVAGLRELAQAKAAEIPEEEDDEE